MTGARALHIQVVLFADAVRCLVREWPEPNSGERRAVFFLRRELCQAVIVNQAEVYTLYKPKLFRHGFSFEQLVLVPGLADGLYERAVDVLVKDLTADWNLAKKRSAMPAVRRRLQQVRPIRFCTMCNLGRQLSGRHLQVFPHNE